MSRGCRYAARVPDVGGRRDHPEALAADAMVEVEGALWSGSGRCRAGNRRPRSGRTRERCGPRAARQLRTVVEPLVRVQREERRIERHVVGHDGRREVDLAAVLVPEDDRDGALRVGGRCPDVADHVPGREQQGAESRRILVGDGTAGGHRCRPCSLASWTVGATMARHCAPASVSTRLSNRSSWSRVAVTMLAVASTVSTSLAARGPHRPRGHRGDRPGSRVRPCALGDALCRRFTSSESPGSLFVLQRESRVCSSSSFSAAVSAATRVATRSLRCASRPLPRAPDPSVEAGRRAIPRAEAGGAMSEGIRVMGEERCSAAAARRRRWRRRRAGWDAPPECNFLCPPDRQASPAITPTRSSARLFHGDAPAFVENRATRWALERSSKPSNASPTELSTHRLVRVT